MDADPPAQGVNIAGRMTVWGGLHGVLLSVERAVTGGIPLKTKTSLSRRILMNFFVFQLIVMTWIPFRADSVAAAEQLVVTMFFGPAGVLTFGEALVFVGMAAAWIWQFVAQAVPLREVFLSAPLHARALVYSLLIIAIAIINSDQPQTFIYFRF
ncbi:hypothetical protein [Bradyrhizobium sp. 1200_D9_N1_1]|uniref:hypothetical protein n=1 Tax=Bradyrhizobium sp. 1200_D9_N1_1 TaxID=3239013 RepID=UPI003F8C0A3A